jgi:serine/threonine-protein kinase RsbW
MIKIEFESDPRDMDWHEQVQGTFEALAIEAGVDGMERILLPMAVVEAVNNIIKHAYQLAKGEPISLQADHVEQRLIVELRDRGRPMPLPLPTGEITDHGADSGRGWKIIRAVFTDVHYERCEGENLLRLSRPITDKLKRSDLEQTVTA